MTLIYFILILGATVFIHELGHFLFAKKAGVYCYEFSVGMGPKIFSFNRKNDETKYCIRLLPIGGFVKMAGEEIEADENIPDDKRMQTKSFVQRFLIIVSGAVFNFLLGIILLFTIALIFGSVETKPYLGELDPNYSAYKSGLREGDLILKMDDRRVRTWDDVFVGLEIKNPGEEVKFEFKDEFDNINTVYVSPVKDVIDDEERYVYGISMPDTKKYGVISSIEYAFTKFISIYRTMIRVIFSLFSGALGLGNLAGPVGIYNLVGEQARVGVENILYLVAFLSINVGFINLIPFPAFDGGRAVFLIFEKGTKKTISPNIENTIHAVGFALLMLLMVIITIQDIKNIIK